MKELKMTYKDGKGRISIDLDRFFPCKQKDFRKMLDIVDISAEKEDCINAIYSYLIGKIDFIRSIINRSDNPQNEFCDCPDTCNILKDPNGQGKKYAGYADILCKRYDLQPIDTDFVVKLKKATFYTMLYVKSKEKYDYVKKDGWTFSKFGYNFEVYKDTYRYVILVAGTGAQVANSDKKKDISFAITEKTLKLLETKKEMIEELRKEYTEKMIELGEVEAPKEEKEYFVESPDFYETKETENVQEEEIKKIVNTTQDNELDDLTIQQSGEPRHEMARRAYIIQALTQPPRQMTGCRKITVKPQTTKQTTIQATTNRMPPGVLTGKSWVSGNLDCMRMAAGCHDTS